MDSTHEKAASVPLFFRKAGEGPPLLILHGVFGSCDNWLTVSKYFMPHFEVFLIDQRNHGRSPHSEAFSYDLLVEDLHDFARQHQLSKFYLIGHSMGGKVAMKFAGKFPEKLVKLVVVDIAPRYYSPHHQQIMAAFKSVDLEKMTSRTEADQAMAVHVNEPDVRQFLLKNLYRDEDGKFAWRINLPVLEKAVDKIGEALGSEQTIETPTLFVKGAQSRYISEKDEEEIKKIFPDSELITIENAGHWVQAEKPDQFAAAVLNFFSGN
jgi:pimeloyl-ACP methyl ester carboxylesterase